MPARCVPASSVSASSVLEMEQLGAAATSIVAYHDYKPLVNARPTWEAPSELRHDAKCFWKLYNQSVNPPNPFSVDEWIERFESRYSGDY